MDVASLYDSSYLQLALNASLNESDAENNNTFRIYRHDYHTFPASLIEGDFYVTFPSVKFDDSGFDHNQTYSVSFDGTGAEAVGSLSTDDTNTAIMTISNGGKGFASDPTVNVLDENNQTLFAIAPSWIKVKAGTETYEQAVLRDLSESSVRGLRGLQFHLSQYSPIGLVSNDNMDSMWLSYRRDASENGLSVLLGDGANDNFWIDMTPSTVEDFNDAFLMPGKTFSDYLTDVHITPIAKGGTEPMEYMDVVVNIGTMGDGSAQAPSLIVETSNQFPETGEFVEMSVTLQNGKASDYGYTWYVNEVHQTSEYALNRPNFFRSFNEPGEYAVRVVVSDLKGGIASRTIVLKVGEYEKAATSSISGTVRSNDGFIQGARVIISRAEVIQHTISMTGNSRDWHLPTGRNNPQKFLLDGLAAPDLVLRRGEVHRFTFEPSTEGYPLSFFDHPEHEMPRVRLKMLVSPQVDKAGDKYTEPPIVKVVGGSLFSNYLSKEIATIAEFNGTSDMLGVGEDNPFEVGRPYAKSLLVDTNITSVRVRPQELNDLGLYAAHGGFGHHRDNPPTVTIHRASFWEDYSDTNATAKAYVDGVGTISPYNRNNGQLSNRWERRAQNDPIPELIIWGSGSDANASVLQTTHNVGNKTIYDHTIQIHNQGVGFEPNATMAVLHYPIGPMAMWTFDKHEGLYDSDDTRFYPSPGWNRELTDSLTHYWAFDEENGTEAADQPPTGSGTTLLGLAELSDANNSHWGAKGRAVHASALTPISNLPDVDIDDDGHTVSVWVKPDNTDTSFSLCAKTVFFDSGAGDFGVGNAPPLDPSLAKLSLSGRWSHIAMVVISQSNAIFYVDGQAAPYDPGYVSSNVTPFGTAGFLGIMDEIKVYSRALTDGEVRYLAGRTFLDLSGNKYHAVPVGGDFTMNDPATDTGSSSDRPTVDQNNNNRNWPRALGDSISGEGSGRSVAINNIDSYLDLSPHISEFEGLSEGTISFWTKPSGVEDRTIFSASNTDENQTHFRIKLRGNAGPVQLTAINDGVKVSEFYTNVNLSSGTIDWRHVVLVVDQTQATFWVDGNAAGSVATPDGPGATRAFLSDIEGINFMAIGLHMDLNATNSFDGKIDDFHIYDRALDAAEISFLYNLRQGRDQVPRLQALADAVGTVVITEGGAGYKELPEAQFSYGSDGNLTSDLAQTEPVSPNYGDLYFDTADDNKRVLSYYVGYSGDRDGAGGIWRSYHLAFGTPEMGETSVDRILWTKDTFQANRLTLPNDRNVTRRYVEYVVQGNGVYSSPSMDFGTPEGLFGYTAVPSLTLEASLSEDFDDHASGYVLFFLNKEESAVIENPGHGLNLTAAEFAQLVRISGKGFRPEQIYRVRTTDSAGEQSWENIVSSSVEQWYRYGDGVDENRTLRYKVSDEISNQDEILVAPIGTTNQEIFGTNQEVVFSDWTHNAANGEPRNVTVDFNQTLSHVVVENPGFGYSLPVSVQLIGGYPTGAQLEQWFDENRTGTPGRPLPYPFVPAVVEVNGTDPTDGGITSFEIIDPGSGYRVAPTVVITGGGGNGAEATATIDENGSLSSVNVVVDLFSGETLSGRGYFNTELNNSPKPIITHTPALHPLFADANVSVLLGGSLSEIGLCPCEGDHTHMDPFIEIWDRNRSEDEIDSQGSRARAVAKVRNGVIEKVVVLDGGRG